jgi:glyoxylase-like metal-dependent hydrolase (beta-lactamase superfamily II)/cell division septum initiation protein DivIVA
MPDESSAAREHAIMQQITAPLARLPDDPVGTVANQDFPVVLRGYDRMAVDAFVQHTAQLVAELHATSSPEGAVRRALERVGGEVSSILQRAHDTAEEITAKSRSESENRLARARQEAADIVRDAQRQTRELDVEVDRIWAERDKIVADVRKLSEELEHLAGAAATRFPAAAPEEPEASALEPTDDAAAMDVQAGEEPIAEPPAGPGPDTVEHPLMGLEPPEPVEDPVSGLEPTEPVEHPLMGLEPTEPAEDPVVGVEPPEPVEDPVSGLEPSEPAEDPLVGAEPSEPVEDPADAVAQPPFVAGPVSVPEPPDDEPTIVRENETAAVVPRREFRVIDLLHLGRERVIGCWNVEDVLIDPGPTSCLATLLDALGDKRPRAVLLTHVHLDHAGASGSLVERWPDLEIYVHERGAPHMMDPAKLLESAGRLYGDDMQRLWGEVLPVPVENVRILRGGEELLNRAFEVVYTPGHASHHVAYMHDGTGFVGDAAGVRISSETLTIPPTPPPDVDVEAWHDSLERLKAWRPERLAITHFGSAQDVTAQLAEVSERLDNWAALARTEEMDTFVATVTEEIERGAGTELLPAYLQAATPEQTYAGLRRYWDKRSQPNEHAPAEASTHAGRFSRPPGSTGGDSGEVS